MWEAFLFLIMSFPLMRNQVVSHWCKRTEFKLSCTPSKLYMICLHPIPFQSFLPPVEIRMNPTHVLLPSLLLYMYPLYLGHPYQLSAYSNTILFKDPIQSSFFLWFLSWSLSPNHCRTFFVPELQHYITIIHLCVLSFPLDHKLLEGRSYFRLISASNSVCLEWDCGRSWPD